jgi:hypothetical protein
MKKKYWWRIAITLTGLLFFGIAYVVNNQLMFGLCDNPYSFGNHQGCLDKASQVIGGPLFIISLAVFIVSIFLYFISDKVFIKWLRFAVIWIILSIIVVVATPEQHNFFSLNPDKETVSIWMGALFVILSLGKIGWDLWREKRAK